MSRCYECGGNGCAVCEGYVLPEGMTAEKLRTIATMMDLLDVVLSKVEFKMGDEPVDISSLHGKEIQTDLRQWADLIDAEGRVR